MSTCGGSALSSGLSGLESILIRVPDDADVGSLTSAAVTLEIDILLTGNTAEPTVFLHTSKFLVLSI